MDWKQLFKDIDINSNDILNQIHQTNAIIYPKFEDTFKSFHMCPLEQLKVVIIGQDCYHGPNQATGLSFAVPIQEKIPPSLRNILKEIKSDIGQYNTNIDLEHWAKQGVLLLNSSLTVENKKPGSHIKQWKEFTDNIIYQISLNKSHIVFCLWGNYAKSKEKLIQNKDSHLILTASHPSPLSANKGGWFGNKHFSTINQFLSQKYNTQINW